MEAERGRMQREGEVAGVVGLDVGDKYSHLRLVAADGEVIDELKIATRALRYAT